MSDPIYKYVKGEGWVASTYKTSLECTLGDGTRVRLEYRKPEIGERYGWCHPYNGRSTNWVNPDNTPNLEYWASVFGQPAERLEFRPVWNGTKAFQPSNSVYVTIVPL